MKKGVFFVFLLTILVLVSCNSKDSTGANEPMKVEVLLEMPEKADPGEKVEISALVTQGTEAVEDADQVLFEIWENGKKDEGKMIEYTKNDRGNYRIDHVFESAGVYYVQVHVDARNMHVMPKKKIIVGDVEDSDSTEEDDDSEHHH